MHIQLKTFLSYVLPFEQGAVVSAILHIRTLTVVFFFSRSFPPPAATHGRDKTTKLRAAYFLVFLGELVQRACRKLEFSSKAKLEDSKTAFCTKIGGKLQARGT